jgi:hypothetical protein
MYQQNSNLHGGVQVMCMQPWFFSIGRLHFGQGFELANILEKKNQQVMKKEKGIADGQNRIKMEYICADVSFY